MSPLSVITIDVDPVLHLGGLAVHWYGVMYAVAFWVGLRYGVVPFLAKRGIDRGESERMCFWVILVGLLSARLYYVVQSSPPQGGSWFSHPIEIIAVWHGGMAFFGAMIGGIAAVGILAWRRGHNFWLIADAVAIFAVLGQPIGRIGNVINGDILGYQSNLPWATAYANSNAILQTGFVNCHAFAVRNLPCVDATGQPFAYQPAAVYEMLGTVAIGLILWAILRGAPRRGVLILAYIELYAVSQVLIFFLRGSEPTVALGLKQAQWTGIVIGLVAVPVLAALWQRNMFDWSGRPDGYAMTHATDAAGAATPGVAPAPARAASKAREPHPDPATAERDAATDRSEEPALAAVIRPRPRARRGRAGG